MRKFLSLILALSIICSLAIAPVWADDEEGDGTVDPYAAPLQAVKANIIEGKASNYAKTKTRLEGFTPGGYIGFKNINFDRQPNKIDCHVGLGSGYRSVVEVRLDSPTGKVIASANFKTSDWSKGRTDTLEITEKVSGVHDVYIISVTTTIHFYKFQFYTDEVIEYTSPNLTFNETIRYPDVVDSPYYNDIITDYNKLVKTCPSNIIAIIKGYKTKVQFVSQKRLNKLKTDKHKGEIIVQNNKAGFFLNLKSNPEFTAHIMILYAKVMVYYIKNKEYGAYTIFDIPIKNLTYGNEYNFL